MPPLLTIFRRSSSNHIPASAQNIDFHTISRRHVATFTQSLGNLCFSTSTPSARHALLQASFVVCEGLQKPRQKGDIRVNIIKAKRVVIGAAAAAFVGFVSMPLFAQTPFETFKKYDSESVTEIDYSPIDQLYSAVSVEKGERLNFRYDVLRGEGLQFLDSFAEVLASFTPTSLSRNEQLAYWLNLRNLLVIRAIASEHKGRNLKNARGDFANPGEMWTRERISVEGVSLSIHDIEKEIILANWSSPEVLYGLYQGVKGGPAFAPPENFSGATVDQQLRERGEHYINSRRVLRVRNRDVRAPAIYSWYSAVLFENSDQAVIAHLQTYAKEKLAEALSGAEALSFAKMNYGIDEEQVRQQQVDLSRRPGAVDTGS